MSRRIEKQSDLITDLAKTHRQVKPSAARSSPDIDRDYDRLMRDGYVIIENALSVRDRDEIRAQSAPLMTRTGRNNFEGHSTHRVYDVLSKTTAIDRLAEHPHMLGLMDKFFHPGFLLSQVQIINILSGEEAQTLHHDDSFYQIPRPRAPLGAATIWAIDDFTEENGATMIIPGSHKWGNDRIGTIDQAVPAVMPAGSVVFFLGTLWHGGGANRTDTARLAVTCQYCEAYMRQQENFLLEISKDRARSMSPEMQALIGYSIFAPFMGMVNGQHPKRLLDI